MKKREEIKNNNALTVWKIWGIPVFGGNKRQVLNLVEKRLVEKKKHWWIATVNPEFVMTAFKDKKFGKLLKEETSLNVADGIGLIWAKEVIRGEGCLKTGVEVLRGKYKNEVIAGSELVEDFCKLAKKRNYRMFFLGGFGDRAKRTAAYFKGRYDGLKVNWCQGRPEVKNGQVLAKINKFRPNFLLVAYGMKKQEEWIRENLTKLNVGVVMGVGRSFDYYSGDLKKAPKSWRKMGLEWLYSLIQEPRRWKRQLALVRFVRKVMREKD